MKNGNWTLVHEATGVPVAMGEEVRSSHWHMADTIKGGTPPHKPSSTGRVWAERGEFFPSVFDLRWVANNVMESTK